jgi:NADH:ubiquinone reductase (non-electrogenic)
VARTLEIEDNSEITGVVSKQTVNYDYLVVACGAENATFNIPGVREHACFLKEAWYFCIYKGMRERLELD